MGEIDPPEDSCRRFSNSGIQDDVFLIEVPADFLEHSVDFKNYFASRVRRRVVFYDCKFPLLN